MNRHPVLLGLTLGCLALTACPACAGWSWQQPHARVLATGDLEWAPHAFAFTPGDSVRYIDFEAGHDASDGRSQATPWKHHPWDPDATDQAAACKGIHTYVFKGGVSYRGRLTVCENGAPGNPIRLTADPNWTVRRGQPAVLCGSEVVTGWRRGQAHKDMPEADKVWSVDLEFAPRNVWTVEPEGEVVRLALARLPNWRVTDPDDIKSEWWEWDNPGKPIGETVTLKGTQVHLGTDTKHLTQPADYYEGAYVWSEYGWVMGTPYPTRVLKAFPERHSLAFGGQWGGGAGSYHVTRYCRYFLEDKPQYLDAPGEFWFEKQKTGGRLYVRLPGDQDPNTAQVEVARYSTLIDAEELRHVHISGLAFRFTNTFWDLGAPPFRGKEVDPACLRLVGSGEDVVVANCRFEHVNLPIRFDAAGEGSALDGIRVTDNDVRYTDHGAFRIHDGGAWGVEYPKGRLYDVNVLRNRLFQIGQRPTRYGHGHAIDIECAQTLEVAGNICDRLYGAGIFVFGGKRERAKVDRPLTRILIHHNKVTDSLLNNNDWGGIETWQGGPAYVFDNVSGNPGGYKRWGWKLNPTQPASARFGHAYYMDGAFKQYYFNNIAWGKSSDPLDRLGNCSAFQEIHGYQDTVFNNTVYNFVLGSRRQAPVAGRNKYLGNLWHTLGYLVFRHANPAKTKADPNAADAGAGKSDYHHESNAYARNVFFGMPDQFAVFESSGRWHSTLDSFRQALTARKSLGDVGELVERSPLVDPTRHDFRPTATAADRGVRVFVPWSLYATVGEWGFYHAGDDAKRIMDEHFYLTAAHVGRQTYYQQPMFPLRAVNVSDADYVLGPLEDWTRGALQLKGRDQYAVLSADELGAAPTKQKVALNNEAYDWIAFDAPGEVVSGKVFQVSLRLKGVTPGLKLRADLHWVKEGGAFGGMNAWGGEAQAVTGQGPYTFRFKPQSKPGLSHYLVTAWLTPTGDWGDHVKVAQYALAPSYSAPGDFKSPQVASSSFLLEAYFRASPGHTGGVLLEKRRGPGYSLGINGSGHAVFVVSGRGTERQVASAAPVNDGNWRHVIAEADRTTARLTLYVDGKADASAPGFGSDVSLANEGDLYVGGTPTGRCFNGTLDFLRVALGTLADSKTTIEELYAWQFDGPMLRDFTGRKPRNSKRDAGAIEGNGI